MRPEEGARKQIEIYRRMSGKERVRVAFEILAGLNKVGIERGRMKRIYLAMTVMVIIGFSFFCIPAFGQSSDYETAARNFLLYLKSDKEIVSSSMIQSNDLDPTQSKVDIAFLANLSQGGYILVSTSRRISPVKAYSLRADFSTLPDAYKRYLLLESESRVRNLASFTRLPSGLSDTEKSWDFLLHYDPSSRMPLEYTPDTYLLTTRWDQGVPYNKFLPQVDGQKVWAGCPNIALAQVMKYHSHPSTGQGVSSYSWNGQALEAVFYRPYRWENMPDAVRIGEEEYKVDEVALFIRDLTIMNKTSFGLDSSPANINFQALAEHFGYSRNVLTMENTDATLFFNTLRSEIDALRPVIAHLPGHATVADGYSSDPTGKKIHLNMGWSGHFDDYYFLDEPIVTDTYIFPPNITIHYNIKPCSGSDCVTNLEAEDHIEGLQITGRFDFEMDADRYDVYLKGATTIGGSRGYANQAFYISVFDFSQNLIASDLKPLQMNLAPGRYTLRISLKSESGFGYEHDQYTDYTIQITTEPLSDAEKASIDAAMDIAPFIGNQFTDRVLIASDPSPVRRLIDARDENGDSLTLSVLNTNPGAVQASLEGNLLLLQPMGGASNAASRIVVRVSANGKSTEKSFVAMVSEQPVGFGKSFEATGVFESQNDFNMHKVILDGDCTITGYNGYSSQAFFSSVLDENSNVVCSPGNVPISRTFTKGVYFLGASLRQNPWGAGMFFIYEPGVNDEYMLSVSCPQADEQTATIAALLGIDLSGTEYFPQVLGDLDGSGQADLRDAILGLQAMGGMTPLALREDFAVSGTDVNGDGKIGMAEVMYILQEAARLR